jgi:phenylacetate-CoA ligase
MAHPLEALYPYAPVWVQKLGMSLYGLFYRHERLGGAFEEYVAQFRARDAWSVEQMHDYVTARLREVLLRAFSEVPYYREVWTSLGIDQAYLETITLETLYRLPTLPKRELRIAPERFVSDRVRRHQRLIIYHTSGSTGTPIKVICTAEAHRRFIAAREVRSFGWAGVSIRLPRSMIGGRMVVPQAYSDGPFYRYNWAEKQTYFSAYHISPQNVPAYVKGFNRYRPQVLTGYAYSHFLLARMMIQQGITLDYEPKALVLSSEKLTPEMKEVIGRAFRARAFEEYGAVENCMLATECEYGSLHVSPDFGIIEIVDDKGHPVPPGREGRVLCTGLLNEAQPLIRYDIGDIGVWSKQPCPCGRNHLPVLQEVVGRLEDVVVGPDGREMVRFHGIFVGLPHVLEAQVVQELPDAFTVRVVPIKGFAADDEALIRKRFEERLGKVKVHIQLVEELERTERGKLRAVVSHVKR